MMKRRERKRGGEGVYIQLALGACQGYLSLFSWKPCLRHHAALQRFQVTLFHPKSIIGFNGYEQRERWSGAKRRG